MFIVKGRLCTLDSLSTASHDCIVSTVDELTVSRVQKLNRRAQLSSVLSSRKMHSEHNNVAVAELAKNASPLAQRNLVRNLVTYNLMTMPAVRGTDEP
ncbi:hypothetical protein WJ09_19390 [Burkholderia vietnamiensis]|nr:hypothetical protein WJ09_19390 [Burkholderia vietnamiensis]